MLKENLKFLKNALKRWNEEHFINTHKRQKLITKELNDIEIKGDYYPLSGEEIDSKKYLQVEFWNVVDVMKLC